MKHTLSKQNRGNTLVMLAGMALAAGCGASHDNLIRIDGSSTVFPITEAVAEEARYEYPEVFVTIGKSGSGGGLKRFGRGELEICNASRQIKPEEIEACREHGIEFVELTVAYDGIVVAINKKNDFCRTLTVDQLKEIFRLDSPIKTWSDLNPAWPSEEIKLYGPGSDSGTYDFFNEKILGVGEKVRTGFTQSEDDNILVNNVKAERYALGYFGYAYYAENSDAIKAVAIDTGDGKPVAPTVATIGDGSYQPLARPLFLYVRRKALQRPDVRQFLDFYLKSAPALAEEVGYVRAPLELAVQNRQLLDQGMTQVTQHQVSPLP
jgi:phosphate transport system substrate-binding protein